MVKRLVLSNSTLRQQPPEITVMSLIMFSAWF